MVPRLPQRAGALPLYACFGRGLICKGRGGWSMRCTEGLPGRRQRGERPGEPPESVRLCSPAPRARACVPKALWPCVAHSSPPLGGGRGGRSPLPCRARRGRGFQGGSPPRATSNQHRAFVCLPPCKGFFSHSGTLAQYWDRSEQGRDERMCLKAAEALRAAAAPGVAREPAEVAAPGSLAARAAQVRAV
jgi:hypothetical protein